MGKSARRKESPTEALEAEEALRVAREKQEKARKAKAARVRNAFIKVSNTEAGRDVFRFLMAECGFLKPSVNANAQTGEIFTDNTVYNEARRNLYLKVRGLIPAQSLVKIEFNLEAADEFSEDED